jgi:hypothetical protein
MDQQGAGLQCLRHRWHRKAACCGAHQHHVVDPALCRQLLSRRRRYKSAELKSG